MWRPRQRPTRSPNSPWASPTARPSPNSPKPWAPPPHVPHRVDPTEPFGQSGHGHICHSSSSSYVMNNCSGTCVHRVGETRRTPEGQVAWLPGGDELLSRAPRSAHCRSSYDHCSAYGGRGVAAGGPAPRRAQEARRRDPAAGGARGRTGSMTRTGRRSRGANGTPASSRARKANGLASSEREKEARSWPRHG